jgi:hypothetical protein
MDGKYGVDLVNCGPPGFKVITELSHNLSIGFKTFLHTPDAERSMMERLAQAGQTPKVVVADIAVWVRSWRTLHCCGCTSKVLHCGSHGALAGNEGAILVAAGSA